MSGTSFYRLVGVFKMSGSAALETLAKAGREAVRGFIRDLEQVCAETEEQIQIPVQHHFAKDVYAREITIPKGALIVGKIHKYRNLNILSQGEVTVLTEKGIKRMKAPCTFVAEAGAKRVIYAHSHAVWTVMHGTDETDLDTIEDKFIAKTFDDVPAIADDEIKPTLKGEQKLFLGSQKCLG